MQNKKLIIDINNIPAGKSPARYLIHELITATQEIAIAPHISYTIDIYGYMTCKDILAKAILINLLRDRVLPFKYTVASPFKSNDTTDSLPTNVVTVVSIM